MSERATPGRRLTALLDRFPQEAERMQLPEPKGRVVFDDVWFVPQGRSEPTIAAVSLDLTPGQAIGVIGPSGAGKSTSVQAADRRLDTDARGRTP